MTTSRIACWVLMLAISYVTCHAQEELTPSEKKQRTIVTEPLTIYKGFIRAQLATNYSALDQAFIDHKKQPLDGNSWGSDLTNTLFVAYGVSDRLMVEVALNYVNDRIYQSFHYIVPIDQDQQYVYPRQWATKASGLGDTDFAINYQIFTETPTRPALALFTTITLPTGTKDVTDDNDGNPLSFNQPTGQGEIAANLNLRLRKVRFPFAYGANVAVKVRNEVSKVTDLGSPAVHYKNGNLFSGGGYFHISLNDWISMRNFADFYYAAKDQVNGSPTGGNPFAIHYTPGFSFQLKRLRLDQFVVVPVAGNLAAADPNYTFIVTYMF